jgi:hypothetical protein
VKMKELMKLAMEVDVRIERVGVFLFGSGI